MASRAVGLEAVTATSHSTTPLTTSAAAPRWSFLTVCRLICASPFLRIACPSLFGGAGGYAKRKTLFSFMLRNACKNFTS